MIPKMKKEVFLTKPLNWNVDADWEFVWKSSIMNYCEAFLQLGIPRFPNRVGGSYKNLGVPVLQDLDQIEHFVKSPL